jgi:chromate transport protein ChrA
MHTLWYVDVDFQMTIVAAPILIYLLWRFGNKAANLIAAITLILSAYASKVAFDNGFMIREIDMYVSFELQRAFSF